MSLLRFFANPANRENQKKYVDALIRELARDYDSPAVRSAPVHAVYVGGGTPTALDAEDLNRLVEAARKYLPLANDCEITIEGRIFNFDEDKIDACIAAGGNRFSIGVQSFDTDIRRKMGRLAPQQDIVERLELLKDKDQAAVIIDLIFGLPGQTMDIWEKDMDAFLELGLDGVDLYQLIRFPGGTLQKAINNNQLPPAVGTAERSAMFAKGVERMNRARYRRLSISHWGRAFRERNLYNLFMKAKSTCLAYGSGAGGYLYGHAYFLEGDLEKYLARSGRSKPIVRMLAPDRHEALVCLIAGELELGRIDLVAAGRQMNRDLETLFKPLVSQWVKAGLVSYADGWMTLTLAGEFWQTNLAQGMIDFYKEATAEPA